jgi:hypothetical protein
MIRHLVLWTLATDDPAEKAQIVGELAAKFAAIVPLIDGTERLDIRADLGDTEGNWDVVLDADHLDADALEYYQVHPAHLEVVEYVKSVVDGRVCIDFEV